MTVWIVWEGSHEEIEVVCATEALAREWVKNKAEATRKYYREETARRKAAAAELQAMPSKEQYRIWGLPGYGEPTLEERMKFSFTDIHFWDETKITGDEWPVEEAMVLE